MATLPRLSYDAVFFYLCCLDADLFPPALIKAQGCCALRTDPHMQSAGDAEIGRFCAAISILLADTKLKDEIRDTGSTLSRLSSLMLRRSVRRALAFMDRICPGFSGIFTGWSIAQAEIEASRTRVSLGEFIGPTAHAFGFVAGMVPVPSSRPEFPDVLSSIGRDLGTAIVALDCALDWQDDLMTGEFNPVTDESAASHAASFGLGHLRRLLEGCEANFGPSSRSAAIGRMVYCDMIHKLQDKHQLDETALSFMNAYRSDETSPAEAGPAPLLPCVRLAGRIGSKVGRRGNCQFGCHPIGSIPLPLGRFRPDRTRP